MKSKLLAARHPLLFLRVLRLCLKIERSLRGRELMELVREAAFMPAARARRMSDKELEAALVFCGQIGRRLLKRPCCQRTTLVLYSLAPEGAVFKLGVRTDGGVMDAHAWIEFEGAAFSEPVEVANYSELAEFRKPL
ncbi:MAG TPA: lasso peptide biosynthesis protein [Bdellovibrionales bacterium]|nr:lasso peptide biosynthesis protein [Bdellovibrionales bacterium]